jgi:hypothetical protein
MRLPVAVVLASLLASAMAQAQDPCLTGASTLADQRALAALTDSTEATCPCAAAATRRTWQRCAKGVLDVTLPGGELREECKDIPSLITLGNIDSVVNNPATRQAYVASATPKLLVEVEHSGHYTFSDGCFPSPDCNPPTTLTQAEAHAAALRYIVPFLERYLAGRTEAASLLGPPTGPGFVYQAAL